MAANEEVAEMMIGRAAKFLFKRFQELQTAGFTESQAFKIILERGLE
jgi:hypothetical protein